MAWASPEYENKLLDELTSRVIREVDIKQAEGQKKKDLIKKQVLLCYTDPCYFIENFLYTDKNPGFFSEQIQTLVPFLLFDFQAESIYKLLEAVEKGDRVFLEKSRQMGISWIICAFALWGFLFRDWKILFLSQKEDYVDKIGDMQSLFQKIRFMTSYLPKRILPTGFSINEHMPRLRIYKPKGYGTGSIVGESANNNAGTGGTYKFVFGDEFSKIENARSLNTSLQATTGCIIYNGTPYGKMNEFYRMRCLAVEGKMMHIRLHWSLNPFYTKEWYEWRTKAMMPEQIAQELEINYDASVTGRVYPRFANIPAGDCKFGDYNYDPYLLTYCSLDHSHGGNDPFAIIISQITSNGKIRIIDSLQLPSYTTIDECASLLAKQPVGKFDNEALNFLERYKEYKSPIFIGDPYDTAQKWNDTSILKIFRNRGINLNVPERNKTIEERIRICQLNMGRIEVNVNTENARSLNWGFTSAIQNARYSERLETSQSTSINNKPIHDSTSHMRTSWEYLINFIVEQEESQGIVGGVRQRGMEKQLVERGNMITGEIEYIWE